MGEAKQIFHVRLEGGEERRFDLDQLDAAYKAGWIDERTMVLPAGSLRWITLGELAGIEAEEERAPYSVSPVAVDSADVPIDLDAAAPTAAARPLRRGVFAAAIGLVVVAGLGFGATRARPGLTSSIEHAIGARVAAIGGAKATAGAAPRAAAQPTAEPRSAPLTNVDARGALDAHPTAAPTPPASASTVPTLTATSLPDAKPAKKKRRGGRPSRDK